MSCISIESRGGFEEASSDVLVLERHRFCWLSCRFSCLVIGDKCGQAARLAMVTGAQQGARKAEKSLEQELDRVQEPPEFPHTLFFFFFFAER